MAILKAKPVGTLLREWREKGWNGEFFFWLGRSDAEVKEMLYKPEKKKVSVTFHDMITKKGIMDLRY